MATLKFDVFGSPVLVMRVDGVWKAYYDGTDGKRRLSADIVIPSDVTEVELCRYLADLCHEWATSRHPDVTQL
jgi:hypothetical protein